MYLKLILSLSKILCLTFLAAFSRLTCAGVFLPLTDEVLLVVDLTSSSCDFLDLELSASAKRIYLDLTKNNAHSKRQFSNAEGFGSKHRKGLATSSIFSVCFFKYH